MVVRVPVAYHIAMVLMVLWKELVVRIEREQESSQLTNSFIKAAVLAYRPMHGIVGSNKKAGIQMGLQQNKKVGNGRVPVNSISA